ncbi:protein-L-isoaspartate O-methyltransferase [Candidatus Woesebacteria bacterium RIFCSPHIGHO2_01_FULL_38_9]|uniref:Protein-L-isoaspartate O-methyltransferase n=2 Tax=Candidatus Woeseibacteriota TaxID=1752722 RepID=A0A1F7Y020_9BACT|nr:MAG: protein-L-isoaspartate O-methyltransferase [Candidatus Woesebacteria bacterium RIFCSPHIGHO2_01_FULL_38_9]OGM59068.1 MAG: protein-L-isoaspartate O-methyltransferase [Candidatus Woesebacteria bacterium RIFCSPLOWO2_01_FULL_39_10]
MDDRERMVYEIRSRYDLRAPRVLSTMLEIPRVEFVPKNYKNIAYQDRPVAIGHGQTMSQPYTVAFMTDLLELTGNEKVLEIGTGSGYQAAVLSKLARKVYTIEIIPELARNAEKNLKRLGYKNVKVKIGTGEYGWKEKSPFDTILVTAGLGEKVPDALFEQLKADGVMVAPIGRGADKKMVRFTKTRLHQSFGEAKKEKFGTFHFVPFVEKKD